MVTVNIPNATSYHNLNTLSGFPIGSTLVITNNANTQVYLSQSTLTPSAGSDQYPLPRGKTVIINGNDIPVWVTGGHGPVIVQSYDSVIFPSETIDPRVYIGLQALTVQSFTEANCKNGTQYEVTTFEPNFAPLAVRDFVVLTGTKPVLIKNRLFEFTGSLIQTTIYKNPVYTGGTIIPYFNLSDINPVTGESVILGAPTVSSTGTQISPTFSLVGNIPQTGQAVISKSAENSVTGLERVLAPNSVYLYRTVNAGTASILASKTTWYEGGLSSTAF